MKNTLTISVLIAVFLAAFALHALPDTWASQFSRPIPESVQMAANCSAGIECDVAVAWSASSQNQQVPPEHWAEIIRIKGLDIQSLLQAGCVVDGTQRRGGIEQGMGLKPCKVEEKKPEAKKDAKAPVKP